MSLLLSVLGEMSFRGLYIFVSLVKIFFLFSVVFLGGIVMLSEFCFLFYGSFSMLENVFCGIFNCCFV